MNKTRSDRALVLGVSTLWLTIPMIYGIDSIARSKKPSIYLVLLMAATILANNVSVLHWRNNSTKGTFLHRIDVLFARILFGTLFLFGINKSNNWLGLVSIFYSFLVSFFYFLSEYLFKINRQDLALFNHLTFRFIGFWWVHTTVAAYNNVKFSDYFSIKYHFIWSFVYYLHCLLLTIYSRHKWKDNVSTSIYDLCCLTLIMWIFVCGIFIERATGRRFS